MSAISIHYQAVDPQQFEALIQEHIRVFVLWGSHRPARGDLLRVIEHDGRAVLDADAKVRRWAERRYRDFVIKSVELRATMLDTADPPQKVEQATMVAISPCNILNTTFRPAS